MSDHSKILVLKRNNVALREVGKDAIGIILTLQAYTIKERVIEEPTILF